MVPSAQPYENTAQITHRQSSQALRPACSPFKFPVLLFLPDCLVMIAFMRSPAGTSLSHGNHDLRGGFNLLTRGRKKGQWQVQFAT